MDKVKLAMRKYIHLHNSKIILIFSLFSSKMIDFNYMTRSAAEVRKFHCNFSVMALLCKSGEQSRSRSIKVPKFLRVSTES